MESIPGLHRRLKVRAQFTQAPLSLPHPNGITFSNTIVTLRLAESRSRQLPDSMSRGSHKCRHFSFHVTFKIPAVGSIADTHHFDADPDTDPSYQFDADQGPADNFNADRIRILQYSRKKHQKTENGENFFCAKMTQLYISIEDVVRAKEPVCFFGKYTCNY